MKEKYIKRFVQMTIIAVMVGICLLPINQYCTTYPVGTPIEEIEADLNQQLHEAGYLMPGDPGYDELVGGSNSTTTTTPNQSPSQPEKQKVKSCNHTYTAEEIKKATCIEPGEMKFTCKNCGDTYTQESEPTGKHKYSSEITKEATCTEAGEETYTCEVCGDTYTEEIKAIGNN